MYLSARVRRGNGPARAANGRTGAKGWCRSSLRAIALEANDKMIRKFDVAVIGTGSAASVVASRCRNAGRLVAVIDSRPFGGTCALRGCDPKKVLVGAA